MLRTVIITLTIPDGVEVRMQQGSADQAAHNANGRPPDAPSAPAGTPPTHPDGWCVQHDQDWVLVPAGVSKTKTNQDGSPKRYGAFWACPTRGCSSRPPAPGEWTEPQTA